MWCAGGFVFMYWIRKYRHDWWLKYNYVTSAALDSGVAIAGIVIFGVSMGTITDDMPYGWSPTWWGNDQDYQDHCPLAGLNSTAMPA
jgi:hypothetical protein